MIFVDTNYFLRFFLKDIETQYKDAEALFEKSALGKIQLFTSVIVFFEIDWVLSSFYKISKEKVIVILEKILKMDFIFIEFRDLLNMSVEIYKSSNLDLEDSFNLVYSKKNNASSFATFDKKLISKFKSFQQN